MIAQTLSIPQFFEAGMLICFGISWPMSIFKSLRTRHVAGKSLAFMVLVLIGYLSGMTAKFVAASIDNQWPQAVTILYILNGLFVMIDITLYFKYRPKPVGNL